MMQLQPRRCAAGGFTLIELLVVMTIVVSLGGLGFVGIRAMMRGSDVKAVEIALTQIDAQLKAYERNVNNGDYPPTLLTRENYPGVGSQTNTTNCGIESVLICLASKQAGGSFTVDEVAPWPDAMDNLDGDMTEESLSTMTNTKDLYEMYDLFGTPIAYFHSRDYSQVESKDLGRIINPLGGADLKVKPWRNEQTKQYYNRDSFQLISAGFDGVFNTEDDITNFRR